MLCGGATRLKHCATSRKVVVSIPSRIIGKFLLTQSVQSHWGPGVDSASNSNEYRGYLLRGGGWRAGGGAGAGGGGE